ncbi:hypothetical protein D3C73_625280 [compost metagenome]
MRVEIVERQFFAVDDAFAGEFDVGVHIAPAIGLELFDRQHLVRRLLALATSGLLLGIGIGTDQRGQVGKQQLIGQQRSAEFGPWLAGDVGQAAVDITLADLAAEFFIAKYCARRLMQLGDQVTVGGVRWRIRQGHAGQREKIAQAGAGQFQAQVEGTEIHRVGQRTGQFDAGVGDLHLSLQWERPGRVLQGQQATNLALARQFLTVILAFDLEAERIVLWCSALLLCVFRRFVTDNLAERNRLAQRVDQHVELSLQVLVVEGDVALVETDRADVQHPRRRFGVRVFRVELEGPVGATVSQALQFGIGFSEVDARDDDTLRQQGQRRNAQFNALEAGHLRRLRPVRVTQAQVFGHHMRPRHPGTPATLVGLASPHHRQVAIDGERTVQLFGNFGIEGWFDPVPIEEHDDQHQHGQQNNQAAEGPGENFTGARHCTELLIRLSAPTATHMKNAGPEPARYGIYD